MRRRGKTHKRTRRRAEGEELLHGAHIRLRAAQKQLGEDHPLFHLCERGWYVNEDIDPGVMFSWDVQHSTTRVFAFLFTFFLKPWEAEPHTIDATFSRMLKIVQETLAPVRRWDFDNPDFLCDGQGNPLEKMVGIYAYRLRVRCWFHVAKEIQRTEVLP